MVSVEGAIVAGIDAEYPVGDSELAEGWSEEACVATGRSQYGLLIAGCVGLELMSTS